MRALKILLVGVSLAILAVAGFVVAAFAALVGARFLLARTWRKNAADGSVETFSPGSQRKNSSAAASDAIDISATEVIEDEQPRATAPKQLTPFA